MSRQQSNRSVIQHMRVALWLAAQPRVPGATAIGEHFGTSESTASHWRTSYLEARRPPLVPTKPEQE